MRMHPDEHWMRLALSAACHGVEADINPRVGCVLVSAHGEHLATGWHRGAGTEHAEVYALRQVGDRAHGASAYITLEPCHHTGRTGPCTQALADAGVARVVYAVADPWPAAAGGARWLREQGITTVEGVLADEAEQVNETWLHRVRTGRPWVVWKFAATLDGRSAATDGTSRWITSSAARADVHAQRARCGALLVGTGTVLADDPWLTIRGVDGAPAALRVVMGLRDLPDRARVRDDAAATVHLRTRDPEQALAVLAGQRIHRVWLEGGPTLAAAFLRCGLVDEIVTYVAPALLGAGRAAVADLGITTIDAALRLRTTDVCVIGGDVRITTRTDRKG